MNHAFRRRAWRVAGICIGGFGVLALLLWAILNDSAPAWLTYKVVSIGGVEQMTISRTGQVVIAWEKDVTTYQVPAAELATLQQQVGAADFWHQQDQYLEHDPPNVFSDMSYIHLTLNEDGRHKTILLRGRAATPAALRTVEDTVFAIYSAAEAAGQTTPRLLP